MKRGTAWDKPVKFSGSGSMPFIGIGLSTPQRVGEGVRAVGYRHRDHGNGTVAFSEATLHPVTSKFTLPPRELPAELDQPEIKFDGIGVRRADDLGESGDPDVRYVLTWDMTLLKHSLLLLKLAAILLVPLASLCAAELQTPAGKPNVPFILADDLGWGDPSCYPKDPAVPDGFVATPHIDALVASGIRCTDGYAGHMVCSPSRAALLADRYQHRFGFYGFAETNAPFPVGIRTLPQAGQRGHESAGPEEIRKAAEEHEYPALRSGRRPAGAEPPGPIPTGARGTAPQIHGRVPCCCCTFALD